MRLGFQVFGVLDGADFDVGLPAGFVAADAGDPDLTVADHGSLGVDEEVFVLLSEDGVGDVVGDDGVVILDEGFFVLDGEGLLAGVDLDGVVNEGRDGGGVVAGDALLELGEDAVDPEVVADGEVDGFVEGGCGGGVGLGGEGLREECAGDEDEACELRADGHSVSVDGVRLCRR